MAEMLRSPGALPSLRSLAVFQGRGEPSPPLFAALLLLPHTRTLSVHHRKAQYEETAGAGDFRMRELVLGRFLFLLETLLEEQRPGSSRLVRRTDYK